MKPSIRLALAVLHNIAIRLHRHFNVKFIFISLEFDKLSIWRQSYKIILVLKTIKLVLNSLTVHYLNWGWFTNIILNDVTHRQRI